MFVLVVNIRIKPENVERWMPLALGNARYLAEAVPLLASRERHVWKRA